MKKRYFVIGVIIVAVATAGVWSFPLWHTAYLLQNLAKSEIYSWAERLCEDLL